MKFVRFSIVVDDCDCSPEELLEALTSSNEWVNSHKGMFQVKKGYYPKEIVISATDFHALSMASFAMFSLLAQNEIIRSA